MQQGRILCGSLMNLINWLLGEALSTCRLVLLKGVWQEPPILQWRWRCLLMQGRLQALVIIEFLVNPVGHRFRCTALFTLCLLETILCRLVTAVMIGRGADLLNLREPVFVNLVTLWVYLTITYRTFRYSFRAGTFRACAQARVLSPFLTFWILKLLGIYIVLMLVSRPVVFLGAT